MDIPVILNEAPCPPVEIVTAPTLDPHASLVCAAGRHLLRLSMCARHCVPSAHASLRICLPAQVLRHFIPQDDKFKVGFANSRRWILTPRSPRGRVGNAPRRYAKSAQSRFPPSRGRSTTLRLAMPIQVLRTFSVTARSAFVSLHDGSALQPSPHLPRLAAQISPLWKRLGRCILNHGEHKYDRSFP